MFKTALFLILIILVWASLLVASPLLLLVAYIRDKYTGTEPRRGWFGGWFYVTDVATNQILGGFFRTTISSELGNLRLQGSRGGTYAADIVDWFWFKVFKEKDHCVKAMESEDKYLFSPFKALCGATSYLVTYFYIFIN